MLFFHPFSFLSIKYVQTAANKVDAAKHLWSCGTININNAKKNDCMKQKHVGTSILRWSKTVARIMVAINTHDETINITSPEVTHG